MGFFLMLQQIPVGRNPQLHHCENLNTFTDVHNLFVHYLKTVNST